MGEDINNTALSHPPVNFPSLSAQTQTRKADHLRICLDEDVQFHGTNGLERYRFTHCCLPELDREIDLTF